jgi:transcriptional regulator with XRE-family HTH domain
MEEKVFNQEERLRIGARVTEIRLSIGMTQEELASLTGIKRSNIARVESGRYNITFDTLSMIATAFNMTIDFTDLPED